uniref:acid phosphatase n=1 Tax=Anisakis simplex TaxID=6269 RepID=A0A0M3K954_ANISI
LKDLSVITGSTITLDNLWYVRDAIFIERLHHKKDNLINDTTYKRIDEIVDKMENYEDGLDLTPVDNINFTVEIAKVRGGGALWAFMNHFELKLFCNDPKNQDKPQCNWMKHMRYYAFSAHDNALSALMATLGAKEKLVPYGYPEYSACLALELWLTSKGPAIRMLYHANASTEFEDVTRKIAGCENLSSDKCDYNIVLKTAKIFYPGKDQENVLCQDTTSPNTDMWTYTKASSASPASSASSASPASSASLASSAGSTFSVNASLLSGSFPILW